MSQSPPQTLGKYQIIREIARSNDIVYEAYDPLMGRRVAVKELAMPGGATQQQRDDRVARFLREARAAGSLVHPNIVTVYEVAEDAGRRYIAMEYLDGQNLRNLLDTNGLVEPKRAVAIALKVLEGLEFAHSKGVVHRDIKPDNIQILESGDVKITDFGIARLTFEPNLTMDGQVFGTPSYMSPEQINGREIDARSDLFSLGVILYECVTGQKPFPGDSVVSITYAIMNKDPAPPGQCNHALWQAISKALDKSPQLRFASAREMASTLRAVAATFDQVVVDPRAATPPVAPPAPPPLASPYGPGMTPYGTPMPGQVTQAPYGHPPAGYGAPYQGQSPAHGQPYGAPVGQPPAPPYGQVYSHPYGQPYGAPGGQPYVPPGQGYPQFPVYYPPPPRAPMVSAATRLFLGRLTGTASVILALAALVYFGIQALSTALRDATVPGSPQTVSPSSSPAAPAQGSAEPRASRSALTLDQARRAATDLVSQAVEEFDPSRRRALWGRAASAWVTVIGLSPDERSARREAVSSFLSAADTAVLAERNDRAREAVYQAEGFAGGDQALEQAVADWRAALGG